MVSPTAAAQDIQAKVTMRYAHLSSPALQEAANAGPVIVPQGMPRVAPKTEAPEAAETVKAA